MGLQEGRTETWEEGLGLNSRRAFCQFVTYQTFVCLFFLMGFLEKHHLSVEGKGLSWVGPFTGVLRRHTFHSRSADSQRHICGKCVLPHRPWREQAPIETPLGDGSQAWESCPQLAQRFLCLSFSFCRLPSVED